jgi:hypothetical protein
VVEHVAAETDTGKTVYIGTRLKVAGGKITEVEINFDDGPQVNAKNLIPYDPLFTTIVPEGERSTREQLERIITSYFQGLTDHKPIEADYDPPLRPLPQWKPRHPQLSKRSRKQRRCGLLREQPWSEAVGTSDRNSNRRG